MRPVRKFNEFVKEGIVKLQSADISRAKYLINESENSYKNLQEKIEKIELNDSNANDFIKSCYDIIMEIIRAKMLLEGYNSSGFGAHEAEVSYMRVLGFNENDIQFTDQLRYFRNGMLYYGTSLDTKYAKKVIKFTKEIYRNMGDNL